MKRLIPLALLAATLLAGCATGPKLSTTEKLALYRDHAGEPVKDFRYFGTLNGWSPLGDAALAVWTKPSEAYLLELSGRCPDLEYAMAISITQNSVLPTAPSACGNSQTRAAPSSSTATM